MAFLVVCLQQQLIAQQADIVLSEPLSGNEVVTASNSVTLAPGFSTNGFTFYAAVVNGVSYAKHTAPSVYTTAAYSGNENYVLTFTPRIPMDNLPTDHNPSEVNENIQYFDGLGRPLQSTAIKASPTGKDIIQHFDYDSYGRQNRDFLPYTAGSNRGAIVDPITVEAAIKNFYPDGGGVIADDDDYPYAERTYDNSPLSRVLEQSAPGDDWKIEKVNGVSTFNGNTVKTYYKTNVANEVRKFTVSNSSPYSCQSPASTYYAAGTLYVTELEDENGTVSREYVDIQGRTVLKIADYGTHTSNINLKTYYIYDDFGRLRYVLPPKIANTIAAEEVNDNPGTDRINKLGYYYKYDERGRLEEKQLPGKDNEYFFYDNRDRLVLSQDGNLERILDSDSDYDWYRFTKYDALDRPIMTGLVKADKSMSTVRTDLEASSDFFETITQNVNTGTYYGYSNNSYPVFGTTEIPTYKIESITYYDTYDFGTTGGTFDSDYDYDNSHAAAFLPSSESNQVHGLVTATRTKVLNAPTGTKEMLLTVNYYDEKGRPIQTIADNHVYGVGIASMDYNFTGETNQTVYTHVSDFDGDGTIDTDDEEITLTETYSYDHVGRLLEVKLDINDVKNSFTESQTLSANKYNELGQVIEKYSSVSGTTTRVASQKTDYRYNIRGWLTKINDPALNDTEGDLYGMELAYNTYLDPLNTTSDVQHNGNISYIKWKNKTDGTTKAYGYKYDHINRILSADYGEESDNWDNDAFDVYGEGAIPGVPIDILYDANGNLLTLCRNDNTGEQLNRFTKYVYNGNQLTRIWENGADPGSDQYVYDVNGNMTKDTRKGITDIAYNHLNLPEDVAFSSNHIEYVYDANGTKLMKQVTDGSTTHTTDYVGSFVYADGQLQYILTSVGRIKRMGDEFIYEYHLKDHLGNTRVAYNGYDDGGLYALQVNEYYPFGLQFNGNLGGDNKYLYNGKEWQDDLELDWYDYGARMYDPSLGRWHMIDPLAEAYIAFSPYHFAGNNPLIYIDENGMDYYYTNDPTQIGFLYRMLLNGSSLQNYDFSGWQIHLTDEEFTAAISYNTETSRFFLQHNYIDDEGVVTSWGRFFDLEVTHMGGKAPKKRFDWDEAVVNAEDWMTVASMADANLPFGDIAGATRLGATKLGAALLGGTRFRTIVHHIASNKHLSKYTPQFEAIASQYGLKLNRAWNKVKISSEFHYRRHPEQYHEFVLDGMKLAHAEAKGNVVKFLELFNQYVKEPLLSNPNMLNEKFW